MATEYLSVTFDSDSSTSYVIIHVYRSRNAQVSHSCRLMPSDMIDLLFHPAFTLLSPYFCPPADMTQAEMRSLSR